MDAKEASTVKRIAGNLISLEAPKYDADSVLRAVDLAIAINDEVNRRVSAAPDKKQPQP